jgi:hypothetical protein
MPDFARNKVLWLILLLGFSAAAFGVWWLFGDRGGAVFFGRDGTSFWTVTSFAGQPPAEPNILLWFDERQLVMDGDCGAQQWLYERDDEDIEISRTSGATVRCAVAPTPKIIDQFSAIRETVTTLKIDGDRLALLDGQGTVVLKAERLTASGYENRTWRVESFQLDQTLTAASDAFGESAKVHITFVKGGIYGYAGCRYLIGRYTLGPDWILMSAQQFPVTLCGQRDTDLTDALIAALSSGNFMTQAKDRLVLKDGEGQTQAILTPWPTQPTP